MGVDNVFRVNLACFNMIKTVLIIGAVIACINAEEYTASRSFTVKVGKTKKTANCDFTISYTGDTASKPDSSVKCSVNWPKNSKLDFSKTLSFTVGDVTGTVFTAEVSFTSARRRTSRPALLRLSSILLTQSLLQMMDHLAPL